MSFNLTIEYYTYHTYLNIFHENDLQLLLLRFFWLPCLVSQLTKKKNLRNTKKISKQTHTIFFFEIIIYIETKRKISYLSTRLFFRLRLRRYVVQQQDSTMRDDDSCCGGLTRHSRYRHRRNSVVDSFLLLRWHLIVGTWQWMHRLILNLIIQLHHIMNMSTFV